MNTDRFSYSEDGNRYVASMNIEESGRKYTIAACKTLCSVTEAKMQYVIYDGEDQIEEYLVIELSSKFFNELTALQDALSAHIFLER